MFDVPVDAWYLWLGLATASVAVFGVAAQLPTEPPPDATDVADAVDAVASSPYPESATHPLSVAQIELGSRQIAVRNGAGTSRASFAYGPVTPVQDGTLLWEVLRGARPEHVFESPTALDRAATATRQRPTEWRPAAEKLRVRKVSWEEVDVTLVEA